MKEILAVNGGHGVAIDDWPQWPHASEQTVKSIVDTVHSGRWALSGPSRGKPAFEQQFAERFAAYNGSSYCVPTANGTSALVIALESLGIGAGDEVIIPGLTWVASATSVLNVNAVPVLVDVDPGTLCIDPDAIEAAITSRTRAISVVHLYCSMADMDRIMSIARKFGLSVVEDCAQAHGAMWKEQRAGTLGNIGTFSMQQTKLLTSGEGGAAITSDKGLYELLFQLRADGRQRQDRPVEVGQMELINTSSVTGNNYCMSEFGASVLIEQLDQLDAQNLVRAKNAELLTGLLGEVSGIATVSAPEQVTSKTYYHYAVRIDRNEFAGRSAAGIATALSAELRYPVSQCYAPLTDSILYQPHTKRRYNLSDEHRRRIDPRQYHLPEAERAHDEVVTLHHPILLSDPSKMELIVEAFVKLKEHADDIPV